MKKRALYWRCQVIGWSCYVFFNIFVYLSFFPWTRITYEPFAIFIISFLPLLLISHLYRFYIKQNHWIKLSLPKILPRVLFAILILSFVSSSLQQLIIYIIELPESRVRFKWYDFFFTSLSTVIGFFIWFFAWSLSYFLYQFVDQRNQALRDEAALKDFELNKLKSQLNPHFIFNALNSIRALVDEDPKKSKEAINQLSNILRSSLVMDRQKLIPFEEELKAVKDYLALETIRFESRLQTEISVDPKTYGYKVPPLMVQTLVENGIKHGISKLIAGGLIRLETSVEEKGLIIKIRNSGVYEVDGAPITGYGLQNTLRRLKLLYGEEAKFSISNEPNAGVLTEIFIPLMHIQDS